MEDILEQNVKIACVKSSLIENINRKLYGEVQTVIDASFSDDVQRKAVKSLISSSFTRNTQNMISDLIKQQGED